MRKTRSKWTVEVMVDCPYCDEGYDWMKSLDFSECDTFSIEPGKEFSTEVECENCGERFEMHVHAGM